MYNIKFLLNFIIILVVFFLKKKKIALIYYLINIFGRYIFLISNIFNFEYMIIHGWIVYNKIHKYFINFILPIVISK